MQIDSRNIDATAARLRVIAPHLDEADVTTLAEIVERLVSAYQPERIYLFGSKARGDSGPDSDLDLLVLVSDQVTGERRESKLAYRTLRGTGAAADVLVWTIDAFESRRHVVASLPATILREGLLLHAA